MLADEYIHIHRTRPGLRESNTDYIDEAPANTEDPLDEANDVRVRISCVLRN
jgi:hypothetical protein